MRKFCILMALICLLTGTTVYANSYYVAPAGNDTNAGTMGNPFGTIQHAVSIAQPGDIIYLRGGSYSLSSTIKITPANNGTASNPIKLWAFPGEKPYLDYTTQPYASAERGILLTADYWYIKGLEIVYAGDNGIKVEGSHNTIELCVLHHNGDTGIQLGFAHETVNPGGALCSYNQVINCDSYRNFDFDSKGGDADGFACKMHNGKGNIFRGCRSWENSDDGWDLFETDWPVEILNCWTWHNGDQTLFNAIYIQKMGVPMSSYSGNGNGFKLGGNGTGGSSTGTHVAKNCVSFNNNFRSKKGFDQNSHKGGVIVHNCTSFGNGYNYMFEDNPDSGTVNEFKNNVSFDHKSSLELEFSSAAVLVNNSWNLPVTASAADFIDISETTAKASREADGSLPNNSFAKLVSTSDLIDKGVNVGLPFSGAAPDLGAFEFNGTTQTFFTLNISGIPAAGGTITKSPDASSYAAGTTVSITAVAASGFTFSGWSGSVSSSSATITITMDADKIVTANFTANVSTFTLSTNALPSSGGSITKNPNAANYPVGTVVTLTAIPATGFSFAGWSGAVTGSSVTIAVTIDANKTVTANFTPNVSTFTLSTNALPASGGSITKNPNAANYPVGTVVTLTAVPATGFSFTAWSGAVTGSSATIAVTMDANKTVTANFTANVSTFTLSTNALPASGGSITKNPNAANYPVGTVVTLTAVPAAGFTFTGWSGAVSSTAATVSVIMDSNKTVTANFSTSGSGTVLRIEESASITVGYCGADGSRQSSYPGADNGFYINISNSIGKGINWKVSVPAAGSYSLKWRYANTGTSNPTNANVLVNGATAANVPFPKTSSWTAWTTTTATVSLAAGVNTIRLETTAGNEFANVDWIEISGNNPTPAACSSSNGAARTGSQEPTTDMLNSEASDDNILAYPNPAKGTLTIQISKPKNSSAHIVDNVGRSLIITDLLGPVTHVDIDRIVPGLYILRILHNGKTQTKKLIVQ